jgi:hypothetical protein
VSGVLDAGALVAVDRDDRRVLAMVRVLQRDAVGLRTSAGALAQVWRHGAKQANLARFLPGVSVAPLDEPAAKATGTLLRSSRTTDVVDAHVALLVNRGDSVLTSDDDDLRVLLRTRRVAATIVHV